jgi:hypothetical protein
MRPLPWIACFFLAANGVAHASDPPTERQAIVRERGAEVMSFSLGATQHVFTKTADGGVQRVVARNGHAEQIDRIRSHLRAISDAFTQRDFSGPAHIHGEDMPGLAALKSAPRDDLTVAYRDIDDGAEITYRARTDALRDAIHRWFDAQLADHGTDATRTPPH